VSRPFWACRAGQGTAIASVPMKCIHLIGFGIPVIYTCMRVIYMHMYIIYIHHRCHLRSRARPVLTRFAPLSLGRLSPANLLGPLLSRPPPSGFLAPARFLAGLYLCLLAPSLAFWLRPLLSRRRVSVDTFFNPALPLQWRLRLSTGVGSATIRSSPCSMGTCVLGPSTGLGSILLRRCMRSGALLSEVVA